MARSRSQEKNEAGLENYFEDKKVRQIGSCRGGLLYEKSFSKDNAGSGSRLHFVCWISLIKNTEKQTFII